MESKKVPKNLEKYSKEYGDEKFLKKALKVAKKAGIGVIYAGLLLYYTMKKDGTPIWAKTSILGSLGYFISLIDIVPDITPIVGYSDDLGVLLAAVVAVAAFIDEDVKNKAKEQLKNWFGEYDEDILSEIDSKIK